MTSDYCVQANTYRADRLTQGHADITDMLIQGRQATTQGQKANTTVHADTWRYYIQANKTPAGYYTWPEG